MSEVPPIAKPAFGLLGSRAMAFVLDMVLVTAFFFVAGHTAMTFQVPPPRWSFYALAALYFGLLPATALQATIGKRMVGLRICDGTGKRIGVPRALVRLAAFVPSIAIAGAGFVLAAFTPRRQALHDLAAATLVVNRDATADQLAQLPAPVSAMDRIVLILLFALPASGVYYLVHVFDHQRRYEEVSALLHASRPYKAEVEKALRSNAPMPAPKALPGQARAMSARPDGTIVIEVADDLVRGARLTLRPQAIPKGEYSWTCRGEGLRYAPAECRP